MLSAWLTGTLENDGIATVLTPNRAAGTVLTEKGAGVSTGSTAAPLVRATGGTANAAAGAAGKDAAGNPGKPNT